MPDVVLDTHVLLWRLADPDRLSPAARLAIDEAAVARVSAVTFWEVGMLRAKRRIELDRPTIVWRRDVLADPDFAEIPITGAIAVESSELADFHGDPADRMIVASALTARCPLVSADHDIRRWAADQPLDVVW